MRFGGRFEKFRDRHEMKSPRLKIFDDGRQTVRTHRDAEADCQCNQQSCARWLENCERHFFPDVSFSIKAWFGALFSDNRSLALAAQILRGHNVSDSFKSP